MVTHFCCCCNLRSGSIVFTWLQLMCIVIIISLLASPLEMVNLRIILDYSFLNPVLSLAITTQVIKIATCLSLIWGLIKNNHLFYQPWLFIQGTENVLVSISIISVIIIGISAQPAAFSLLIPLVVINGLSWYFWACIHAVYKVDTKISPMRTNGDYEVLTVTSSVC